jgi:hypothetical protein
MSIDVDYENPWFFEGVPFLSENINDNFGFVYLITNIQNNRKYIGRKYFWSFRTPKGKKRKVKSESDWKKYYGSCPELKEDIDRIGKNNFTRTIISLHKTGGKTNFEETRQLFINGVLTESLDNGTQGTIIATSSADTSEKTTMNTTTEEIVGHLRDWSLERAADKSVSRDDARAIIAEFCEWIDPEDDEIEIYSFESKD